MQRLPTKTPIEPGVALRLGLGIMGAAIGGAALMYFFDPQRGRRRRVMARGKLNRIKHRTTGAVGATSRDLRNRAYGIMAETKSLVSRKRVSDEVLAERVRARLGSLVSRASSIQVWSDNGTITLSGAILAGELEHLIRGVSSIRGVTGVENLLTLQTSFESIPGDPRSRSRVAESRFAGLPGRWSATTRFLVGALSSVLAAGSAVRRSTGSTVVTLSLALLAGVIGTTRFLGSTRLGGASRGLENGVPQHNGARNDDGASD